MRLDCCQVGILGQGAILLDLNCEGPCLQTWLLSLVGRGVKIFLILVWLPLLFPRVRYLVAGSSNSGPKPRIGLLSMMMLGSLFPRLMLHSSMTCYPILWNTVSQLSLQRCDLMLVMQCRSSCCSCCFLASNSMFLFSDVCFLPIVWNDLRSIHFRSFLGGRKLCVSNFGLDLVDRLLPILISN